MHIAVITETHAREGNTTDIQKKGYILASTCQRRQGEPKGGVAIYAHESIPQRKGEKRITQPKHELEHCSEIVHPNHNEKDQLAVAGAYRAPEREHPEYAPTLSQMLQHHKEQQSTAKLKGDFNINSWGTSETGFYQKWVEGEGLRELSNRTIPTRRTGTVTDGILMAVGKSQPEGLFPQVVALKKMGEMREPVQHLRRRNRFWWITTLSSWKY